MGSTRKKTSKKNSKNSVSNTKAKVKTKQTEDNSVLKKDAAVIVSFLLALLLFLSNLGLIGTVGAALKSVQLGLFGAVGYILPVIIFIVLIFILANKDNPKVVIKLVAMFLALLSLAGLVHVIWGKTLDEIDGVWCLYEAKEAGGLLGGLFAGALISLVNKLGAGLILLAVFIISAVAITEKSFVGAVKKGSSHAYKNVKEDVKHRHEEAIRRKEEYNIPDPFETGLDDISSETENPVYNIKISGLDTPVTDDELTRTVRMEMKGEGEFSTTAEHFVDATARDEQDGFNYEVDTVPFDEDVDRLADSIRNIEPDIDEINQTRFEDEKSSILDAKKVVDGVAASPYNDNAGITDIDSVSKTLRRNTAKTDDTEFAAPTNKKALKPYKTPPVNILTRGKRGSKNTSDREYKETALKLQETLRTFGVNVTVSDISVGPVVTRYELHPEMGVKVNSVLSLQDDIKLSLAAADIRIEAPIPGKAAIGIEVPNKENNTVMLRDIFESTPYKEAKGKIAFALGKDIAGETVVTDIAKMPHLLIAGATGSGKSVCINTLILSILYKYSPEQVKMIMVDPKVVELSVYNGIPHLMIPVVNDPKKAAGALNWAVQEMMTRYKKFEMAGVRDIAGYNAKVEGLGPDVQNQPEKLPYLVIIIDELADLMMAAKAEVEDSIVRIAQLARAAGIHLVIATQRPSVDVITGLIKANIPSRIAFAVSSGVDSRTILDGVGAEKLLGKGDMLFSPQGSTKPQRIQGAFVTDEEIQQVVDYIKNQNLGVSYDESTVSSIAAASNGAAGSTGGNERDDLFIQAGRFIIDKDKASIGNLQRAFRIGFNRAARIMDQLCDAGVVGPEQGTKPREVLMSEEQFENYIEQEG